MFHVGLCCDELRYVDLLREWVIWFLIARCSYVPKDAHLNFIISKYLSLYGMNYIVAVSTVVYHGGQGNPNIHVFIQ